MNIQVFQFTKKHIQDMPFYTLQNGETKEGRDLQILNIDAIF